MNKRVVITGMGIISPLGNSPREFFRRLCMGEVPAGPLDWLDLGDFTGRGYAVGDFDAGEILGKKGLRYLNKGTLFLASAMQTAVDSARFSEEKWAEDAGVIIGTSFGNFPYTTDYTQKIFLEGPENLMPMESYDVALNSGVNYISVRFGIKGISRTISSGFTSALDAVIDAFRMIRRGESRLLLTGGVEQISIDSYRILSREYLFCDGEGQDMRPYGKDRAGFLPGEGSVVFVLEELEHALERHAEIYAEILGWGSLFSGNGKNNCAPAMEEALEDSRKAPESVNWIVGSGSGLPDADKMEAEAIAEVFGKSETDVSSIKRFVGEGYGVSGGFSLAAAVMGMKEKTVPGSGPMETGVDCPVRLVRQTVFTPDLSVVLVNALDQRGNSSHLVLSPLNQ
jgi:3-oxoacyl-[acyl-carrier-protein] synthase II